MTDPTDPDVTAARDASVSGASSADETAPAAGGRPKFGPPTVAGDVGTLGPYRVVKQLGAGGMGAVYLGVDTRLDRKLALKVMLPEFAANRDAKERFLREAKAAAKVSHDNVVTVYEADERDGTPYIAMQFLQGYPLDEYLKNKGAPPLAHVARIGREAALGLAAAHAEGLIHRDVKPGNIWLEAPNGRVKVLDFGLAKPVGSESELTTTGAVVGTPAYMSPEQARGLKVDARTDLFSLGVLLYRLCTGRTPFAGPNVMAVLMALGSDDPTPVRELNPNVPQSLADLIHQLLAKKPEQRPQTAAEVAQRLRAVLDGLLRPGPAVAAPSADVSASLPVVHALPVQPNVAPLDVSAHDVFAGLGDVDEATHAEAADEPNAERKSAVRTPQRGGKGVLIGAAVAALVAVGVVAAVVSQMGKKGDPVAENKGADAPADASKGTKGTPPKPPARKGDELPTLPAFDWKPVAAGASPFDKLDPNQIPAAERFVPLPRELVAVIGSGVRKHWDVGVSDVVISPDGKWAATRNHFVGAHLAQQQLFVWNVATRAIHAVVPPEAGFWGATFAPDSRTLYVATDRGLVLYPFLADTPALQPWPGYEGKGGLFGPDGPRRATFSPDGKTMLLSTATPLRLDVPLQVWDSAAAPPRKVKDVENPGHLLGFSADRAALLTVRPDADGSLRLVSIPLAKDGPPKALFALPPGSAFLWNGSQPAVALSPDGKTLAVLDKGGWKNDGGTLYDLTADPPKETRFRTPDVIEGGVEFTPDGKTLTRTPGLLLDLTQNPPAVKFRLPLAWHIARTAFTPDGKTAVAGDGVAVRFWDVSGAEPKELDPLPPGVAYSYPNDRDPVVASERGLVGVAARSSDTWMCRAQFWDLTGSAAKPWPDATPRFAPVPHLVPIVTLTRDGTHAVVNAEGGARSVKLTATGFEEGAKAGVSAYRWNFRDGRGVLRAADGSGVLWDVREPFDKAKPLPGVFGDTRALPLGNELATARDDGKLLAVWRKNEQNNAGAVLLWNVSGDKPTLVTTLEGNYAPHTRAFSPDGRYLSLPTSHTYPDGVHVYDLSGKAPRRLPNFGTRTNAVLASAFTPDARRLATVADSGHLEVFDVATQARVWEAKLPGSAYWTEFAPDGRHLFTHNSNGTVYVLRLPDLTGAADRAAAEWVLSVGGNVQVNGDAVNRFTIAELPKGPITLTALTLKGDQTTDAMLANFQHCQSIWGVRLVETPVTDAGLVHLKRLAGLTHLNVEKTKVTAKGVADLAAALPKCRIEWDGGVIEPSQK